MGPLIRFWIGFLFISPILMTAQENAVEWTPEVELKWNDFKGTPNEQSIIAAVTASGISYTFNALERDGYYEVDYTVNTFFYPDQSWYRPQMCDELVLSHENLHFDITELFARKMRKEMDQTHFTENVRAEIKAIYNRILKELAAFQQRYDTETDFSRNRGAQLRWNQEMSVALQNTAE